jgi:hypothetical protein
VIFLLIVGERRIVEWRRRWRRCRAQQMTEIDRRELHRQRAHSGDKTCGAVQCRVVLCVMSRH